MTVNFAKYGIDIERWRRMCDEPPKTIEDRRWFDRTESVMAEIVEYEMEKQAAREIPPC